MDELNFPTMKKNKHYRQGDVLLKRIDSLPTGLTKVPRVDGRIIVALGSSNGNPHYIDEKGSEQLRDADWNLFYSLVGISIKGTFQIAETSKLRVLVNHPKLGQLAFDPEDINEVAEKATINGRFALLKHAEHNVVAIPAGNHSQEPQRGHNRGETRRVQD